MINTQICLIFSCPPLWDAAIFKYQQTFESIIFTSGSFQHYFYNNICSISHQIPYNTIRHSTDKYMYFEVKEPPMSHINFLCVAWAFHWPWLVGYKSWYYPRSSLYLFRLITIFMAKDQRSVWGYWGCEGNLGNGGLRYLIQPINTSADRVMSLLLCRARRPQIAVWSKDLWLFPFKNGFVLVVGTRSQNKLYHVNLVGILNHMTYFSAWNC